MNHMKILIVSVFLLTSIGVGQPISFGLRGGVPFTGGFSEVTTTSGSSFVRMFSDSNEFVIGPMVELHLPLGLSVEADALYHPLNLLQEINNGTTTVHNSMNINSWEFPILGKFRFLPLPLVKPYVEAGPSFRATGSTVSNYFEGRCHYWRRRGVEAVKAAHRARIALYPLGFRRQGLRAASHSIERQPSPISDRDHLLKFGSNGAPMLH